MKFYSSFPITPENYFNNRAIAYGDGIFETMMVKNKAIVLWNFHWQRLSSSLVGLNINPMDEKATLSKILSLVSDNKNYIVKLVVFRDDSKRGYGSHSNKFKYFITLNSDIRVETNQSLTISQIKLSQQNELAGMKHLNRLEQVLAAQRLNGTNYSDAIMCDDKDCIIETISKNIVFIKNEQLYTPNLNESGVYGVALRWLNSSCQKLDRQLNWKKIEIKDLSQYHGMLVCNSIQGFTSISNIGDNLQFEQTLPIMQKIKEHWNETIGNI